MRVVLHAHSTWSYDGHWPLEKIARIFGAFGVGAVMMSEHDTGFDPDSFTAYRNACRAASTPRCRLIPGIEYSSPDNSVHILTWGLHRFLAEHRPVMETLRAVDEAGGVAIFAHPIRREAWKRFDPEWAPYLSGIELWNRKSDGICWSSEAWNLIRATGLPATVGVDFHRIRQIYPLFNHVDATQGAELEDVLVRAISEGALRPSALFRSLLNRKAAPRSLPHRHLENLRQSLAHRLRASKQRRSG